MDSLPDIFNNEIIPSDIDRFWADNDPLLDHKEPRPVLVITCPLENEGKDQEQLLKMLQACRIDSTKLHILELPEQKRLAWHLIREKLNPKYVFLVGVEPEQLGMSVMLMPNQVTQFDGAVWIITWSMPVLEKNPDAKRHLWNYGLKPVFIERSFR